MPKILKEVQYLKKSNILYKILFVKKVKNLDIINIEFILDKLLINKEGGISNGI